MDYSKISKEGVELLNVVIDNDEKNISTSPEIAEDLLNKFTVLSEATEKVLRQNQRENEAFQESLSRTLSLINKLEKEKDDLLEIIESNRNSIQTNTNTRGKAQKELNEIGGRITEAKKEIESLKPKIVFQWWWIFCWVCGLIAAGIQNEINAKMAEIEKIQLKADLLESSLVNKNIGEFNKTLEKLQKKLTTDQAVLQTLKGKQKELDTKAALFSDKTASSLHLNNEIKLFRDTLQGLYDKKGSIFLLKGRLNKKLKFCNGKTHQKMPMEKILSGWGLILNEELTPIGANVQAVRLAIEGKEFGHFRKLTAVNWELVGTPKFDSYKHHAIAKILAKGQFKEMQRDQWSIYLQDDSHDISIDIWKKLLTATNKSTKEAFTTEIIDGSLAEKVLFYEEDHISQEAVAKLCLENNWRLASEFELTIAWVHNGLNLFGFGQLRNNLVAVPIQVDTGERFKRGLNIMPFNSKGSGNQGFFYIENKILTFRELKPTAV